MKRLARKEELMSQVEEDGAILVEGEYVGRIKGFDFIPDGATSDAHGKALKAASLKAVTAEIAARAMTVAACPDPDLSLTRFGEVVWQGSAIARLEPGGSLLKPRIAVGAPEYLFGAEREAVQARLEKFLSRHVAAVLEPLVKLEEGEGLAGICKGIAFRLVENFGILPREQVAVEVKALAQEERASLRALGVRFGAFNIHVPAVLKPAATELRLLLWGLERAKREKFDIGALPAPPGHGLTSAPFDRATPKGFYRVCGYRICGPRVVRIDMLERLADFIRNRVFWRPRFPEEPRPSGAVEGGGFAITPEMMSLVGCSGEEFQAILRSLDFRMQKRRVKKPEAPPVKQPEAIASLPDTAEETPAPLAASNEAAAETLPAPSGQPAAETPPVASDQAPAEPDVEIEVWWPKDAGPFHRPSRQPHRPRAAQKPPKEAQTVAGEVHPPKLKPVRHKRERAPERQPSPDSPFAVLGELRARLAAKKS
jgi:ATP-dependent RNA helicase SUPV3L1/SUV3